MCHIVYLIYYYYYYRQLLTHFIMNNVASIQIKYHSITIIISIYKPFIVQLLWLLLFQFFWSFSHTHTVKQSLFVRVHSIWSWLLRSYDKKNTTVYTKWYSYILKILFEKNKKKTIHAQVDKSVSFALWANFFFVFIKNSILLSWWTVCVCMGMLTFAAILQASAQFSFSHLIPLLSLCLLHSILNHHRFANKVRKLFACVYTSAHTHTYAFSGSEGEKSKQCVRGIKFQKNLMAHCKIKLRRNFCRTQKKEKKMKMNVK